MASEEVCRMIHDLHLNDHPIGASAVEKGDAEEDSDISDEDSDSDSHLFDDKPVATEEDTTQDSDDDYGYYRCVGCTEPDSTWNRPVQFNPFFEYASDEEPIGMTMEDIDAIFDREDITIEYINELQLASFPSR